jgi:hypothetical protein
MTPRIKGSRDQGFFRDCRPHLYDPNEFVRMPTPKSLQPSEPSALWLTRRFSQSILTDKRALPGAAKNATVEQLFKRIREEP